MQELFVMIGLSVLLAAAAFAAPQKDFPRSSDHNLTSVPREMRVPSVPSQGTMTFTDTSLSTRTKPADRPGNPQEGKTLSLSPSVPETPAAMPEEQEKPTGFK